MSTKPTQISKKKIAAQLHDRLTAQKICSQHYYIQRMNSKLQLPLSAFQKDPKLSHTKLTKEQLIAVLFHVKILERVEKHPKGQVYRLNYPNSLQVVLITGITFDFIRKMVQHCNKMVGRRIGIVRKPNQFWIAVEMDSVERAFEFKKRLRSQKRICDLQEDLQYKILRKRVRIVIQNEDLFTLLVDAMSQQNGNMFIKDFGIEKPNGLYYQKVDFRQQNFQSSTTRADQDIYEDNLSEDRSRTTDGVDIRSMNDVIERIDQGIQAEKIQDPVESPSPRYCKEGRLRFQNSEKEREGVEGNQNGKGRDKSQGETLEELPVLGKGNVGVAIGSDGMEEKTVKVLSSIEDEKDGGKGIGGEQKQQPNKSINQASDQTDNQKGMQSPEKQLLSPDVLQKNSRSQSENRSREFRYEFILLKRLFHQHSTARTRTAKREINIPKYLVKEDESQFYKNLFLDGYLKHGKRKNILRCVF